MKHTAEKITTVAALAAALKPDVVLRVPPDLLEPDPDQPRTDFPKDSLKELADDIKRRGIEDPIQVRSNGERILIKHGERRWRAAQLAKLKEVPVLLAAPEGAKAPDLERLFDQALHNKHHEQLTPMDWARFLRKLVEVHGLAVKDVPTELEKRGITMSRPYVSNLMRLTELPDWAASRLNEGELLASDAKAILMAKPYPKAMAWLKQAIEERGRERKEGQRLRDALFEYDYEDMEQLVAHAYEQTAIELSNRGYGDKVPLFKWETSCKGCPDRQQLNKDHFCLNATCFDAKQDKARAELKSKGKSEDTARKESRAGKDTKPKKPAGPTTIPEKKINPAGEITVAGMNSEKYHFLDDYDLRFEPVMNCGGCPHNKMAIEHKGEPAKPCCFNIPCFEQKQRSGNREEGVAQWLDERLLPLVLAKLPGDDHLLFSLLAWMALDAPTQTEDSGRVESFLSSEQHKVRRRLNLRTPGDVFRVYQEGGLNTEAIAAAGVRALLRDRGHFYAFARYLKIPLTPAIASMDKEYVGMKRKGELLLLMGMADDAEFKKKKLDELIAHCLSAEVIAAVGVPPDVKALYENLSPKLETIEEHDDEEEQE